MLTREEQGTDIPGTGKKGNFSADRLRTTLNKLWFIQPKAARIYLWYAFNLAQNM